MSNPEDSILKIYDTIIQNLQTEGSGGGIYVNKTVSIIEHHTQINDCNAQLIGGGSYFANISNFDAFCLSLSSNAAALNPASLYNCEDSNSNTFLSYLNSSSFCFHTQNENDDKDRGSPLSFYYCKVNVIRINNTTFTNCSYH